MPGRKDTAKFIAEAIAIHGERYDYSKVVYVKYRKRVEIICPVHGSFWQTPALHVKGRNCRKCSALKATEAAATYCRFCGVRVTYSDAYKKRCRSIECKKQHLLSKWNSKVGCVWADIIGKQWHREKRRQAIDSLTGWERKCATTWISLWSRERWRKEIKPTQGKLKTWDWAIDRSYENARHEAEEATWNGWKLKVVRFCREATQGRRNMDKRMGKIKRQDLLDCLEQQDYRCALTGWELTPETAQIDHKDPVSKGGKTEISNLQWLHEKINRMKGTMPLNEFLRVCKLIADTNPPPPY
jgi:hypothetical protein